jgi:hypothetical protein
MCGADTKVCDKIMIPPTRREVADVLQRLLSGELTRNAASDWAETWLLSEVAVGDSVAWDAIKLLGAATLVSTDRLFLYDEIDFALVLKKLRAESSS